MDNEMNNLDESVVQILRSVVLFDYVIEGGSAEKTIESGPFVREVGRMLPKKTFSWMSTYRSRAARACLEVGTAHIMGGRVCGYFVPMEKAKDLARRLNEIREGFMERREEFLAGYPRLVEDWASAPQNDTFTPSGKKVSDLIRQFAPSVVEMEKAVQFWISATRIESAGIFGDQDAVVGEVRGLAGQAAQEIANDVLQSWAGSHRSSTTARVLGLIRRIRTKAEAMQVLSVKFTELAEMCTKVLAAVPAAGSIDGIAFLQVSALLDFCSSPANILRDHAIPFDPLDVSPADAAPDVDVAAAESAPAPQPPPRGQVDMIVF